MIFTDERARNLIARLFTYSPRTGERSELENYCTEALAWCLIISESFAAKFLDAIRKSLGSNPRAQLRGFKGQLQVSTQISFKGEDILQDEEGVQLKHRGRFDLVLASGKPDPFLIVIESKVKLDPELDKQVADYRAALKNPTVRSLFEDFKEDYVLTLTPSTRHDTSDGHLSWGHIHRLITEHLNSKKEPREFSAFADFLKLNYLSSMNIPPITSGIIENFQRTAPFLSSAKTLFARFSNDEVLKSFFRPLVLERPDVDFDKNGAWYGVGDSRRSRWAYAGFFMKGKLAGLYVDVEYAGNRLNETSKLGDHAQRALKEAKRLFDKTVLRADQKTWFHFAHQLQPKENEDDYLEWFTVLFTEISKALD
jgi:hypothetical protein